MTHISYGLLQKGVFYDHSKLNRPDELNAFKDVLDNSQHVKYGTDEYKKQSEKLKTCIRPYRNACRLDSGY